MKMHKIVITGGPCGGKTTALSWLQNAFTLRGYKVIIVPETATELISGGVAPWTCGTNLDYQKCQMALQLSKERIFEQGACSMPDEKILLICDRGALDNKAYMTAEEFAQVLSSLNLSEVALRDSYDAVFHLVTAAKGVPEAYTLANNQARYESPEDAVALDDRIISSWTGHPHLRIIDNSKEFEDKMKWLLSEVASALGEAGSYEIERKYLIAYPDLKWLESNPHCSRVEIYQTYLQDTDGTETRVRQRGLGGQWLYYETKKKPAGSSGVKRVEIERRLTQEEYLSLLMSADTERRQIRKTRYCLTWNSRVYEIDVYPFWHSQAVCEVELSHEDEEVLFPPELRVLREVTGVEAYRNAMLSRHVPAEEGAAE